MAQQQQQHTTGGCSLIFLCGRRSEKVTPFLSSDGANQTRIVSVKSPPVFGCPLYNAHRSITAHTATTGLCFFFVIDQIPTVEFLILSSSFPFEKK
jgi:hypothetical protein